MSAKDKLQDADLEIREALPDDAHAIAALYVWHVLNYRASFEDPAYRRRNAQANQNRAR